MLHAVYPLPFLVPFISDSVFYYQVLVTGVIEEFARSQCFLSVAHSLRNVREPQDGVIQAAVVGLIHGIYNTSVVTLGLVAGLATDVVALIISARILLRLVDQSPYRVFPLSMAKKATPLIRRDYRPAQEIARELRRKRAAEKAAKGRSPIYDELVARLSAKERRQMAGRIPGRGTTAAG